MYQRKDGEGSLFRNGYKQKETHPDHKGEVLLGGVTYEVAGWNKAKRDGEPWISIQIRPKREREHKEAVSDAAQKYAAAKGGAAHDFDDPVPF